MVSPCLTKLHPSGVLWLRVGFLLRNPKNQSISAILLLSHDLGWGILIFMGISYAIFLQSMIEEVHNTSLNMLLDSLLSLLSEKHKKFILCYKTYHHYII